MIGSQNRSSNARSRCGLYIHVPFCETKCGYCDFFSVALKGRNPAPLVDRLIRELKWRTDATQSISTVFVGGGTPTLLPLGLLKHLLDAIGEQVEVSRLEEFTVEANPATVDDDKARVLVDGGVSRVSMGAQSFQVDELATLERLHSPDDIAPSVEILRRGGVQQINLDLIFGIPGQTLASWKESLRRAIELGPDHIACYGLTYEPATRLTALRNTNRLTPCDEDLEADMFLTTIDLLAGAGYEQYEISNYAKPGCQSEHNLIYWRNEPYIGVGPSAAGCLPIQRMEQQESEIGSLILRRYKNVADILSYVRMMDAQGHAEAEAEIIRDEILALEMILMQLRLNEGLSLARLASVLSRQCFQPLEAKICELIEQGLLRLKNGFAALTPSGRLLANRVIAQLAETVPGAAVGQN